ncbi:hypothetical protein SAMN02745157_3608 [Kaistia soli DSM 19436]|uniref:Protease inhibitor Inh n=1 Tax=Kaistia soli DSM 19436 TaxID=1122133 RepID=A0A1M5H3G4_9HYPH|nr:hypothetical protein [Kaistia soli]SHG10282.1 hypothetical protein SAMN02745157_3608 [Kaistia soli DSM 19436]
MKPWLISRGAIALMALVGGAGLASADPLAGIWNGQFQQVGEAGTYRVTLDASGDGIKVDYADQSCGGTLEPVGEKGNSSFYIETITRGGIDPATGHGCIGGNVTLIKVGDTFVWGWVGEHKGKPLVASATLEKAK